MVKYDLFNLTLPWIRYVIRNSRSRSLTLSLLVSLCDLVVFLLGFQVLLDHIRIHFNLSLVNNSLVILTQNKTIKFLEIGQFLKDCGSIAGFN